MQRPFIYTLSFVAGVVLVGGYVWVDRLGAMAPAGPLEPVRIANVRYPGSCPLNVAEAKGYLANEGIAATMQTHTSGKLALDSVLRGDADLAVVADLPVMFAVLSRQPVAIVATVATAENEQGIIGRRDRGIATRSDLKGKRIGLTLGSSAQFVLDGTLTRQRLSAGDVVMHDMKPEELLTALLKGDIDAAAVWQPHLGMLEARLGDNGSIFLSGGIYDLAFNLVGMKGYVSGHPQAIQNVLRALIRGAKICEDDPATAQRIVAEAMSPDVVDLADLWPAYNFRVVLDQSLLMALEDETRWAIRNRLAERTDMPNYLDHIDFSPLLSVAPKAVTIIH